MQACRIASERFYKLRYRCNGSKQNSNNKQVSFELTSQCRRSSEESRREAGRLSYAAFARSACHARQLLSSNSPATPVGPITPYAASSSAIPPARSRVTIGDANRLDRAQVGRGPLGAKHRPERIIAHGPINFMCAPAAKPVTASLTQ